SVAFRTLPHYITHSAHRDCELINGRGVAYRLGPDGNPVQEFQPGEVIFRGRVRLAAAGTTPFYGFGMRAFPFAGRLRGMMHCRVVQMSNAEIFAHLPGIWQGKYFTPRMPEFAVSDAVMRFDGKMPLEVAGDACGYQSELHLEMCPETIELV